MREAAKKKTKNARILCKGSNLDFSSSKKDVVDHLNSCSAGYKEGLRSVSIPPPKDGKGASGGYCFVEYASAAHANKALEALRQSKMGVRVLDAHLSTKHEGASTGSATRNKKKGFPKDTEATELSKLAVRNVAFQASEGELHALFAAFGSVKRVKAAQEDGWFTPWLRFRRILLAHGSPASYGLLSSTHLYGRHLILEWAKVEEG